MSRAIDPNARHPRSRLETLGGRLVLAVSATVLAATACGDDSTSLDPEEDVWPHECTPYEPTPASETFAGTQWEQQNENDTWNFTVPGDPGGGYVTVTLTAQHEDVVPWLTLDIVPAGGAPISSGAAAVGEQTITDVFEIAAGRSVEINVKPWFNAPAEDYPVRYSLSYAFTSRVDCYEPNDDFATAKAIPVGEIIEATTIVGHDEAGPPSGARLFDFYKFTLTRPRTLNIATVSLPDDVQAGLRVFRADRSVFVSAPVPSEAGRTTETGMTEFPAGTFYIEFFPSLRGASVARTSSGEPTPPHFTGTYRLLISEGPS